MKILKVRNFKKFQHYHNRMITKWIRLYFHDTFDDDDFWSLRDAERWKFIGMVLWAGKKGNNIPFKYDFLAEKISHEKDREGFKTALDKLIDMKFVTVNETEDKGTVEVKPKERKKAEVKTEINYENLTDNQKTVLMYKESKGFDLEDKEWNERNFGRYSKDARILLDIFKNNLSIIADCIEALSTHFNNKKLEWHLGTIAKWAEEWKLRKGKPYDREE